MFLFRMLSVKKVKNRSEAFGPSAAITAGMAVVAVRSTVAGSVVVAASEVGLFRKFMGGSGPLLRSILTRIKGVMRAIADPRRGGQRPLGGMP